MRTVQAARLTQKNIYVCIKMDDNGANGHDDTIYLSEL